MLDAMKAEFLKLRHHQSIWFLVLVYPIVITLGSVIGIAEDTIRGNGLTTAVSSVDWVNKTSEVWLAPNFIFGRFMIGAYVAVVFAGEYGWNTWKLIVPHRERWTLVAAKYLMVFFLLSAAFSLGGILAIVLNWVGDLAIGRSTPSGVTLGGLAQAHWIGAIGGVAPLTLIIAYTSLAAILTRSTLAAFIASMVVTTCIELLGHVGEGGFSHSAPELMAALHQFGPGYNLKNIQHWLAAGAPLSAPFPGGLEVVLPLAASVALITAWVGALIAFTFITFLKQDLN